jgi:hypothetical protein
MGSAPSACSRRDAKKGKMRIINSLGRDVFGRSPTFDPVPRATFATDIDIAGLLTLGVLQRAKDTVSGAQTFTIATRANVYSFHADSGTTNSSFTTSYNLTGISGALGNLLIAALKVEKGVTSGSQNHIIDLKINGTHIYSLGVSSAAAATSAAVALIAYNPANGLWSSVGLADP